MQRPRVRLPQAPRREWTSRSTREAGPYRPARLTVRTPFPPIPGEQAVAGRGAGAMRNKARAGLPRRFHPPGQLAEAAARRPVRRSWTMTTRVTSGCGAAWLARHVRDVEAAGSSPATPTRRDQGRIGHRRRRAVFLLGQAVTCRTTSYRDMAQSGSALGWGPRGRWFKSSCPDAAQRPRADGPRVRYLRGAWCWMHRETEPSGNMEYRGQVRDLRRH